MSEHDTAGHERSDLHPRPILWSAVGLVVTLIVVFVAVRMFQSALSRDHQADATRILAPHTELPLPRLQINPATDLATLRAAEEATLHSYGWVDRKAGVIHIPIERAIELTAERGLPARPDAKGARP